ncbi:hypothetical protein EYF80_063829 [Liparis tanakae]|uniref:Uncharacterized protein n=1 Tax=Liparis tanakae TaxID=230148 RepID=A0A4Z2EBB1_9TELE|nr:hypothetical protein EYF80_063829 [Liparis tanakae]
MVDQKRPPAHFFHNRGNAGLRLPSVRRAWRPRHVGSAPFPGRAPRPPLCFSECSEWVLYEKAYLKK